MDNKKKSSNIVLHDRTKLKPTIKQKTIWADYLNKNLEKLLRKHLLCKLCGEKIGKNGDLVDMVCAKHKRYLDKNPSARYCLMGKN